jgi:Tol biopolymer transport system component
MDVWLLDLEREVRTRFTFGILSEVPVVWAPDGSRLIYTVDEGLLEVPWIAPLDGSREPAQLLDLGDSVFANDWSADGRFVIFDRFDTKNQDSNLWVLPLDPKGEPFPFLETEHGEWSAVFSPDGRWVAYNSSLTGRDEIFVRAFPDGTGFRQVSAAGGNTPRWRHDGRELFYLTPAGMLMAVAIEPGPELVIGRPRELFDSDAFPGTFDAYDVTADGQRFLINRLPEEDAGAFTLVTNWVEEVPER